MSVRGEFRRLVADCLTLLETSALQAPGAWRDVLTRADARCAESLTAAARMVLELDARGDADAAPRFAHAEQERAFRERAEHLCAICRAIVG